MTEETKAKIELENPREKPEGESTDMPGMWEESFRRVLEEQNRYFHYNEVGYMKMNFPRLRTETIMSIEGQERGNVRPRENQSENKENRGSNENDQK